MQISSSRFFLYIVFLVASIQCTFAQTITATGSLNSRRLEHCSQVLANGKVLVFGGDDGRILPTVYYQSAELYDPATGTWSYTGSMNVAREWFTSHLLNNGNVLAIGGQNDPSSNDDFVNKSCEVYNVATGSWSLVSSMLTSTIDMSSVKLNNGNILVAGGAGNIKTQIYNPETDVWTYTGDMKQIHGSFIGMALLDDGKILATGGNDAPRDAEIYDPATGEWTLLTSHTFTNHSEHTITRLKTGSFLIVGTGFANTEDQFSAELYDPNTKTFSKTGTLLDNVGAARTVLLDNGNVLLYCLGLGGKAIQIYNPSSGSWSSTNPFFFSANHSTVNMLHNGKVLLVGGTYTVAEYASNYCYLVTQDGYNSCSSPSLVGSVQGAPVCNGFAGTVTLSATESGVQYEAWIGGRFVGAEAGNGGALGVSIQENLLVPGANVVNVKAVKAGCASYMLADTAIVYVTLPSTPTPVITPAGPLSICSGQMITLTASPGMSAYQWSSGQTNASITVAYTSSFRVRVREGAGCYTRYSEPVQVTVLSNNVFAGPPQSVCSGSAPFALTGFSPAGGTWSGPGVSAQGVFNPVATGAGTFTLTYMSCNTSATKTITVEEPLFIPDFTITQGYSTNCFEGTILQVANPVPGVYYEFRHNNVIVDGKWGSNDIYGVYARMPGYTEKETVYTVLGIKWNGCTADTLKKQFTFQNLIDPTVGFGTKKAKICKNDTGYVYITNSQRNVMYRLTYGNTFLTSAEGTGDTLFISTGQLKTNKTFGLYISHKTAYCQYYLTQKVTFEVTGPSAFFTFESYNVELGNEVVIKNSSINSGGTDEWSFTPGAGINTYANSDPPVLVYNAVGNKVIQLKCTSAEGCTSTLVKKVNIIEPFTESDCNAYSLSTGTGYLHATAVEFDYDDNVFQCFDPAGAPLYNYSPRGDSLYMTQKGTNEYNYMQPIVKYNSKGIIQWATFLNHNNNWANGTSMTTDVQGNLYYAYFNSQSVDSIRIYSTNGGYITFAAAREFEIGAIIVVKFNKDGIYQWHNTYPERYTSKKIGMVLDNNLNLYVSSELHTSKFTTAGQREWLIYTGYRDLKKDSKGNIWGLQYEDVAVDKLGPDGSVLFSTSKPVKLSAMTQVMPDFLEIDEEDNLYVSGRFFGQFIFNKDTLTDIYLGGPGHSDLFLAKISSTGQHKWIKQINVQAETGFKGMDYKNGKILFAGFSTGTIFYNNTNHSVYQDTLSFLNIGNFICSTDTSAQSMLNIITVQENGSYIYNTPYDLIAYSKKTDKIIYSSPDAVNPVLGNSFAVQPFFYGQQYAYNSSVLITLKSNCLFPVTALQSRFSMQANKCVGVPVQFTDVSNGIAESWSWSFTGNGMALTSIDKNPSVTFNTAGQYVVTLTTANASGAGTTIRKAIQMDLPPTFTVAPQKGCRNANMTLVPSDQNISYYWNGEKISSPNYFIPHLSKDTSVLVTGVTKSGCSVSIQHTLHVQSPVVTIAAASFDVCLGETVYMPEVSPTGGNYFVSNDIMNNISNNRFVSTGLNPGNYDIGYYYADMDGCGSMVVTTAHVKNCNIDPDPDPTPTAILNYNTASSIVIYPNPCKGQFRFQYPDLMQVEKCEIRIYNSTGQIVLEKKNVPAQSEMIMDVSSFASGLYVFVLQSDKGIIWVSNVAVTN